MKSASPNNLSILVESLLKLPQTQWQGALAEAGASPEVREEVFAILNADSAQLHAYLLHIGTLVSALEPPAQEGASSSPLPTIPGYEILGELGRGGMGVVYKARQEALDRVVALKTIRAEADEADQVRFLAEARASADLKHPHLVTLYELGRHGPLLYFTLELVEGGSLAQKLASQPLAAEAAARLVEQIARGIQHAHERGIVHRDLKPANILLTPAGTPKVADFGLARRSTKQEGVETVGPTITGAIVGTPSYLAPEQAEGQGGHASAPAAVDVYGLGTILYECLTARPPFRGPTLRDTLLQVVALDPVSPRRLNPAVPRDLDTICLKCLEKDPSRRYLSARDLADDLQRFAEGRPILARPVSKAERCWHWCRKNPVAALTTAIAMVSLLLLIPLGLSLEAARQVAQAEAKAREEAERSEHLSQELAASEHYHSLFSHVQRRNTIQPLGWTWTGLQKIAEAATLKTTARDLTALRTEAVACLTGVDVRPKAILMRDFIAGAVAFDPAGEWLAVAQHRVAQVGETGQVRLLHLPSKTTRELRFPIFPRERGDRTEPGGGSALAFSPDGRWLALGTRSGWIHRWNRNDLAAPPVRWKAHHELITRLVFSPDNASLYSSGRRPPGRADVKRWRADGKEQLLAEVPSGPGRALSVSPDGRLLAYCAYEKLQLCEADTLTPTREALPHSAEVVCFDPDGHTLAVESRWGIKLLAVKTGTVLHTLEIPDLGAAHEFGPDHLEFSPDGALLLSTGGHPEDRAVRLWDVAGGSLLVTLSPGDGWPLLAAFHPGKPWLLTSANGQVVLHEVGGWVGQSVAARGTRTVRNTKFSADGQWLACLGTGRSAQGPNGDPGQVTLWNLASGRRRGHREVSWAKGQLRFPLGFHPDAGGLAWRHPGKGVRCWHLSGREAEALFRTGNANALRFSPDGLRLWAALDGGTVQSWDWPTGVVTSRWQNPTDPGNLLEIAVSRRWVLAGGLEGQVHILRADTGRLEATLAKQEPINGTVSCVALSPDEGLAVWGTSTGVVRVVRVPSGGLVLDAREHLGRVTAVTFGAGGRLLATGSQDGTVRLYLRNGNTLRYIFTLRSPTGPVANLEFRPKSLTLALSVRGETAVRLWHLDKLHAELAALGLAVEDWPSSPAGRFSRS
jgi:eukaryotic-like serine/threonine-protein kinase